MYASHISAQCLRGELAHSFLVVWLLVKKKKKKYTNIFLVGESRGNSEETKLLICEQTVTGQRKQISWGNFILVHSLHTANVFDLLKKEFMDLFAKEVECFFV